MKEKQKDGKSFEEQFKKFVDILDKAVDQTLFERVSQNKILLAFIRYKGLQDDYLEFSKEYVEYVNEKKKNRKD